MRFLQAVINFFRSLFYRSYGFVSYSESWRLGKLGVIVFRPVGGAVIGIYAVGGGGEDF